MTPIDTERLRFRPLRADDLDDLYALYRDPEIRRYFPDGTRTLEQTREELDHFVQGIAGHPALGLWATVHKASGRFIGRCGLLPWMIDGQQEVELAFLIAKPYWGQGLGSEAARAIAEHAFGTLHLRRLVCLIMPGNDASFGVARRIGMQFEKRIVDTHGPALVYAMLSPDAPPPRPRTPPPRAAG
jgi:ribosomal-protein-alanine N-acetyltransferase